MKPEIKERAKDYIAKEKDASFRQEVEKLLAESGEAAEKELADRFYQNLEFGTAAFAG